MHTPLFDSVVFRTARLAEVRRFYEQVLGLHVATFEKDGATLPDADGRYVNFQVGPCLLGFETGSPVDRARVVLRTGDLVAWLRDLSARGVVPKQGQADWAIVEDPEQREVILQQGACD